VNLGARRSSATAARRRPSGATSPPAGRTRGGRLRRRRSVRRARRDRPQCRLGPEGLSLRELARSRRPRQRLAPGIFPSDLTERPFGSPYRARTEAQAALGRVGRPEELVGAILLLAWDARSYITGYVLTVDGGTSAAVGVTPYTDELFGLHAAAMPGDLGRPLTPVDLAAV